MKKNKVLLLIITLAILIPLHSQARNKIRWMSFKNAFILSKKYKKPMMIYLYTKHCPYCRKLEKDIFQKTKIITKLNSQYYNVGIDGSQINRFQKDLQYIYSKKASSMFNQIVGRGGVPKTIFMNSKGEILVSFPGYSNTLSNVFYDLLNYIVTKCYEKNIPFRSYQKTKKCKK